MDQLNFTQTSLDNKNEFKLPIFGGKMKDFAKKDKYKKLILITGNQQEKYLQRSLAQNKYQSNKNIQNNQDILLLQKKNSYSCDRKSQNIIGNQILNDQTNFDEKQQFESQLKNINVDTHSTFIAPQKYYNPQAYQKSQIIKNRANVNQRLRTISQEQHTQKKSDIGCEQENNKELKKQNDINMIKEIKQIKRQKQKQKRINQTQKRKKIVRTERKINRHRNQQSCGCQIM